MIILVKVLDTLYEQWLESQLQAGGSERKRRLSEERHAEDLFLKQVWLPAIGKLEHLHAEYEVDDYKDGQRFLDYAYLREPYKICIEIDGYGPHLRDADRRQFADNLMRQNHLILDGWMVIRFSYDDVKSRPRQCQQLLQQLFGKLFSLTFNNNNLSLQQKEILRYMQLVRKPVTPKDISLLLSISSKYARKLLIEMVSLNYLQPAKATVHRVRTYKLQAATPRL
ncbi:DNA-binding response regulator [Paenibacillus sp. BK720]|uniref:DNA-binding response regulator n=1 Tax=Paenibacillus sp. BK720 TaxID=2587092 RepID=UPI001423F7AD|nr:very-short-patch-repair endonuclease [Paenibacillus sp. BK720]